MGVEEELGGWELTDGEPEEACESEHSSRSQQVRVFCSGMLGKTHGAAYLRGSQALRPGDAGLFLDPRPGLKPQLSNGL